MCGGLTGAILQINADVAALDAPLARLDRVVGSIKETCDSVRYVCYVCYLLFIFFCDVIFAIRCWWFFCNILASNNSGWRRPRSKRTLAARWSMVLDACVFVVCLFDWLVRCLLSSTSSLPIRYVDDNGWKCARQAGASKMCKRHAFRLSILNRSTNRNAKQTTCDSTNMILLRHRKILCCVCRHRSCRRYGSNHIVVVRRRCSWRMTTCGLWRWWNERMSCILLFYFCLHIIFCNKNSMLRRRSTTSRRISISSLKSSIRTTKSRLIIDSLNSNWIELNNHHVYLIVSISYLLGVHGNRHQSLVNTKNKNKSKKQTNEQQKLQQILFLKQDFGTTSQEPRISTSLFFFFFFF